MQNTHNTHQVIQYDQVGNSITWCSHYFRVWSQTLKAPTLIKGTKFGRIPIVETIHADHSHQVGAKIDNNLGLSLSRIHGNTISPLFDHCWAKKKKKGKEENKTQNVTFFGFASDLGAVESLNVCPSNDVDSRSSGRFSDDTVQWCQGSRLDSADSSRHPSRNWPDVAASRARKTLPPTPLLSTRSVGILGKHTQAAQQTTETTTSRRHTSAAQSCVRWFNNDEEMRLLKRVRKPRKIHALTLHRMRDTSLASVR